MSASPAAFSSAIGRSTRSVACSMRAKRSLPSAKSSVALRLSRLQPVRHRLRGGDRRGVRRLQRVLQRRSSTLAKIAARRRGRRCVAAEGVHAELDVGRGHGSAQVALDLRDRLRQRFLVTDEGGHARGQRRVRARQVHARRQVAGVEGGIAVRETRSSSQNSWPSITASAYSRWKRCTDRAGRRRSRRAACALPVQPGRVGLEPSGLQSGSGRRTRALPPPPPAPDCARTSRGERIHGLLPGTVGRRRALASSRRLPPCRRLLALAGASESDSPSASAIRGQVRGFDAASRVLRADHSYGWPARGATLGGRQKWGSRQRYATARAAGRSLSRPLLAACAPDRARPGGVALARRATRCTCSCRRCCRARRC
jgi:hypothetical protein